MTKLCYENLIKETVNDNAVSFIIEEDELIFDVAYKVLQRQEKNGLIKCGKLSYNGKIKLVYDVSKYKSLSILIPNMNSQNYLLVISKIVDILKSIEENGFVKLENTHISIEKIYIDIDDLSVHMICLPINKPIIYNNHQLLYDDLKNIVTTTIEKYPQLQTSELNNLIPGVSLNLINSNENIEKNLESEESVTIEQEVSEAIVDKNKTKKKSVIIDAILSLVTNKSTDSKRTNTKYEKVQQQLVLSSINLENNIKLVIDKPIYTIGKQEGSVNGVIKNQKTISRVHCKVINENKKNYIVDMGSLNGTYINNRKILEGEKVDISKGDVIKLSCIEFLVV